MSQINGQQSMKKGSTQAGANSAPVAQEAADFYDADANLGSPNGDRVPPLQSPLSDAEREELRIDLAKTEDEINTLRQVLAARTKHAHELRRKLGISAWKEITTDVSQSLKGVKDSSAYQRTGEILQTVGEKTTGALSSATKKMSELRSAPAFKSFEDRLGTAYTSVKTKIAGSTSFQNISSHQAGGGGGQQSVPTTPGAGPR